MARLPIVGGDAGNWGTILNEYLQVSHNGDGTLKTSAVTGDVDANARVAVAKGGTTAGTRRTINLIEGTGVTITAADDAANEKVDVTINATGGIADPGANGVVVRTAANTTAARTLTGTTNQVTITNGDGVSGNPTFALPQDIHTGASPTFNGLTISGAAGATGFKQVTSGGTVNQAAFVNTSASGGGGGAGMIGYSNDGAAMASGDRLGFFLLGGSYNTSNGLYNAAGVLSYTTEAWGDTNRGADIRIETTAVGATARSERARFDDTGLGLQSNIYFRNTGTFSNTDERIASFAAGNLDLAARGSIRFYLDTNNNGTTDSFTIFNNGNATIAMQFLPDGSMLGLGATAPTHSLTIPSAGTGIALYNTADQTTNYERGILTWASDALTLATQKGGSGSLRNLTVSSANELRINATGTTFIGNDLSGDVAVLTGATNTRLLIEGTQTGTSGTREVVRITPTINQSGTAAYTALLINPTETATGSGSKLLLDAQVGGASKLNINSNGSINFGTAYGNPHIIPTTNELIVGHYSDSGAAFEIYSYAHATRAGEFATIYGGGVSQGQVTFIHYNGTDFNTRFAISATGDLQLANGGNIVSTTGTGTKIGTSTTQKLGFFNATPVVQQTGSVITALGNLGLVASATIAASDITSGSLAIARGGTGGGDAATARTNLAVAEASGFAKMTVGTSAPGSPAVGDLWVDTN